MSAKKPVVPEKNGVSQHDVAALSDGDLDTVTGGDGKVHHSDISVQKLVDVATPKLT